jgi:hypothetical protein
MQLVSFSACRKEPKRQKAFALLVMRLDFPWPDSVLKHNDMPDYFSLKK